MSGWSDIAYKAALTNPDIVVADDSTMPAAPREGRYNARHDGNRYIASQVPTEAQEQAFLFDWIDANIGNYPPLRWAFHVPNGEFRHPATAGRLATMGVRRGVPDVLIPCIAHDAGADKTYVGLAIELKRSDRSNHTTPEQDDWLAWLDSQEWRSVVCYGAAEAIRVIREYLGNIVPVDSGRNL